MLIVKCKPSCPTKCALHLPDNSFFFFHNQDLQALDEQRQRRLEERPVLPLTPLQRPIILPGGRKWSQPDDACPSVRHPKMTDEKIAGTIETFSEVLVGRTKGQAREMEIGFLNSVLCRLPIGTIYGLGLISIRQFIGRYQCCLMVETQCRYQ